MGVLYNRYMVRQESPITERLLNLYFIYLAMSLTVYGVELFDISQKLHYLNFPFYQVLRNFISQRKKMAGGQQWKMSWKGYLYVNKVSHKLVKEVQKTGVSMVYKNKYCRFTYKTDNKLFLWANKKKSPYWLHA